MPAAVRVQRLRVSRITLADWADELAAVRASLPFGEPLWLELGLASNPDLELVPAVVSDEAGRKVLVPVCVGSSRAQVGCFGYGGAYPAKASVADWSPTFAELAPALSAALRLPALHTLLPPLGLVAASDALAGDRPTSPGRPTFVLELGDGIEAAWRAARGSSRTATRSAEKSLLRTVAADPAQAGALRELYALTLGRNEARAAYEERQLAGVLGHDRTVAVAALGEDTRVQSAAVFVVGADVAFHVLQVTSPEGRRTNAGHLAFWRALRALHARGVNRVDLGSATSSGQERFKRSWGAVARDTRLLGWPEKATE
jgi:GNAT acetyltransferase-like protein